MEQIRAFIAIELPEDVKTVLSGLLDKLRKGNERAVKWVSPEGTHLTLKFLGNIPEERVPQITVAVRRAAAGIGPCTLELKGLGAFPNLRTPRVVWVGVGGDVPNVIKLQKTMDNALIPLGFIPEKREFSPHLTLGRVRDRASSGERLQLGGMISSFKFTERPAFLAKKLSLMKSTLTSSGAIYDCLASVSLDMD